MQTAENIEDGFPFAALTQKREREGERVCEREGDREAKGLLAC